MKEKKTLSRLIQRGEELTLWQRLRLTARLSVPAIVAQISAVVMEYIDASMVGSLGASASASIGIVTTSTWLFMGLCSSAATGFSVQVAHLLGASQPGKAREVLRQALTATLVFSLMLALAGGAVSGPLPRLLGGDEEIHAAASQYFLIFTLTLPALQLYSLAGGMLRCSGNMLLPGVTGAVMCLLDVVFNFFLIFPTRELTFAGMSLTMPGAGLGVAGAATGTASAGAVGALFLLFHLWRKPSELCLKGERGSFMPRAATVRRAFTIALPMGVERFVTSAAQITLTIIVAPLGNCAIAANAFAVTAEGLCYMPGYGIGEAATTLIGQSLGAGKKRLAQQFAYITVATGMTVMTVMGAVMYLLAPAMIGFMTPDPEILALGTSALRIEAFAEPMFAAAIVCYGVFVGAGDTLVPCIFNLGSMWIVRITLAALLAPVYGLQGVWLAMAVELCCRGMLFLGRLRSGRWMDRIEKLKITAI